MRNPLLPDEMNRYRHEARRRQEDEDRKAAGRERGAPEDHPVDPDPDREPARDVVARRIADRGRAEAERERAENRSARRQLHDAVTFAAAGFVNPLIAAILMPLSSGMVISRSTSSAFSGRKGSSMLFDLPAV